MRMLAPAAWAPLPPLVVTWAALTSVLSFRGLAVWTGLGGLAVWWLVAVLRSQGRVLLAVLAVVVAPVLVAGLAETVGGNTSGPLTRATFLVTGLVAVSTLLTFTAWLLLSLVPSVALLGAVLGLGAADFAGVWVGAWVVALGANLLILGPYRAHDLRDRGRLRPVAVMLLSAGVVGVLALVLAALLVNAPWTIPGSGAVAVPVGGAATPRPALPSSSPSSATASAIRSATPSPVEPSTADAVVPASAPAVTDSTTPTEADDPLATVFSWLGVIALVLLVLLVLVLLWHLAHRGVAWFRWWRRRRQLRRGGPEARVVGAWTWARLQRMRGGDPLPTWASPDVAERWAATTGDPSLARLARITARVAFNPDANVTMADAGHAWEDADTVARRARGTGWRQRSRWSVTWLTAETDVPDHVHPR